MATVVNDRDVLLQAPGPRYTASSASALLIAPSAPAFNVDVGGTPTPSSITFDAVRLNVSGAATFSTSDGSPLTVNGDRATLTYASMVGNSTVVTVSVTDGGTVYSRSTTITKVRDGASGTGTTGQRGAGTYQASGSAWSDTTAHLATPGETVVDDQVIIWNGSNFAEQRRWDGSAWVASGAHIPGDLIVGGTIVGNKLKAGTIELFAADGVTPILTLGGGLRPGFEAPGTKNSDLDIGLGTGNKIVNSGPYPGSLGSFFVWGNNTGATVTLTPSYDPYRPAGNGGVYVEVPGTPAAGALVDVTDTTRPVVANRRYEFSVYLSTHRCKAFIYCAWLRADGSVISYSESELLGANHSSGYALSGWGRLALFATAPAETASVMCRVRLLCDGGNNPYVFASMWYFGAALPAQTVPSDWSDGASGTAALIDAANASTAAANAQASADAANNGLADKLSKSAASTLNAPITLSTTGGIVAGTLTWSSGGARTGGYGVAHLPNGIVAYNSAGLATFVLEAATGNATFRGTLDGAGGNFGVITFAAGGSLSSGQTAYDTGTGFWMGYVGGVPKFSIGTAGGGALLWDGTDLIARKVKFDALSATISGTLLTAVGNGPVDYGSLTVSASGGTVQSYDWSVTFTSATGISTSYGLSAGAGTATASFRGNATNMQIQARISCTVVFTDGRTVSVGRFHNVTHGTYQA